MVKSVQPSEIKIRCIGCPDCRRDAGTPRDGLCHAGRFATDYGTLCQYSTNDHLCLIGRQYDLIDWTSSHHFHDDLCHTESIIWSGFSGLYWSGNFIGIDGRHYFPAFGCVPFRLFNSTDQPSSHSELYYCFGSIDCFWSVQVSGGFTFKSQ